MRQQRSQQSEFLTLSLFLMHLRSLLYRWKRLSSSIYDFFMVAPDKKYIGVFFPDKKTRFLKFYSRYFKTAEFDANGVKIKKFRVA